MLGDGLKIKRNDTSYAAVLKRLLASDCTSYKLKHALSAFDNRDPLDAARDAETLHNLMQLRLRELGL